MGDPEVEAQLKKEANLPKLEAVTKVVQDSFNRALDLLMKTDFSKRPLIKEIKQLEGFVESQQGKPGGLSPLEVFQKYANDYPTSLISTYFKVTNSTAFMELNGYFEYNPTNLKAGVKNTFSQIWENVARGIAAMYDGSKDRIELFVPGVPPELLDKFIENISMDIVKQERKAEGTFPLRIEHSDGKITLIGSFQRKGMKEFGFTPEEIEGRN